MRQEQREAQKRTQDRKIAETERFIERFRAKASKAKQAQSRVKALEKMERVELIVEEKRRMRVRIPTPPRSGDRVIGLQPPGRPSVGSCWLFQLQLASLKGAFPRRFSRPAEAGTTNEAFCPLKREQRTRALAR